MINILAITAILVGSVYGLSIPFTQTYPTTSGTGLKITSLDFSQCTSLPCTLKEGTSLTSDLEFESYGNYDFTNANIIQTAVVNGQTVEFMHEACDMTYIVSGDTDGNPCTLNTGGKYKFAVTAPIFPVLPVGEFKNTLDIVIGDTRIAEFTFLFELTAPSK